MTNPEVKQTLPVAKDGIGIIAGTFVALLIFGIVYGFFPHPLVFGLMVLVGFLAVFNLFFFRDPNRDIPQNPLAVISPADGRVTQIVAVDEPVYFQKKVQRISIFLSVFNVHVNRSPYSGKIDYFNYKTGKFLAAFKEKASIENEQTVIGISGQNGNRVLFKQIAGLIARRIVCHLREGDTAVAGKRMGLIRYGSRMDVFLPMDASVQVKVGDTVRAGSSVLAVFPAFGGVSVATKTIVDVPNPEPSS